MIRFKYIAHHITTGKQFRKEDEFSSETDFLRHLNNWNRMGGGDWLYFSDDHIAPMLPAVSGAEVRIEDHSVAEVDRLVETGIWSKNGTDQPDRNERT